MSVLQVFFTAPTTGSSDDGWESSATLRQSRDIWGALGRLLLILLLAAVSSDRASASCGDYLHTRTSSPTVSAAHDAAEMEFGEKHQGRIPCTGPECRSVPRSPVMPPVVPGGVVRNPELAMVDFGIVIESPDPQNAFVLISSTRVARRFPARIDVPPECV